jgi:hypothetical protein
VTYLLTVSTPGLGMFRRHSVGMSVRLYMDENCVGCFYVTKGVIDILKW